MSDDTTHDTGKDADTIPAAWVRHLLEDYRAQLAQVQREFRALCEKGDFVRASQYETEDSRLCYAIDALKRVLPELHYLYYPTEDTTP